MLVSSVRHFNEKKKKKKKKKNRASIVRASQCCLAALLIETSKHRLIEHVEFVSLPRRRCDSIVTMQYDGLFLQEAGDTAALR